MTDAIPAPDLADLARGTGLDVAAACEPAPESGGDFYDVVRTPDGRLVLAVGDVAGKGPPSLAFMGATIARLREQAARLRRPDEIIRAVSDALSEQNPHQLFVTLFVAVFDPETGSTTYASAGHPSPMLIRPGGTPAVTFGSTAMMAGLFPEMPVDAFPMELARGDTLVIYTDGVTNAFNAAGTPFGERGLIAQLSANPYGSAAETVEGLRTAIRQHVGRTPLADDLVILAIRAAGPA